MLANYLSAVYDLTSFGIFKIKNAMVSSDKDDGITIEVSFDGGSSFQKVDELNTKFNVARSTGKVQVKITFEDVSKSDIYKVKASGFFQNLDIGTTITFTKISTGENFPINVGRNGYYNISLPRGLYDVWYLDSGKRQILMTSYNPEISYVPTSRVDKEAIIDGIFKDVDWAKFSVFDTFSDRNKMVQGSVIYDPEGDLSDGVTNRKCRYWVVAFE